MPVCWIENLKEEGVEVYSSLTEHELKRREDTGLLIAESPKVIKVAVESGYEPVSLLCESKHITGDASEIIGMFPDLKVYTGSRETLSALTGYILTRGVLCAMKRPEVLSVAEVIEGKTRIVVLESVCDTTNIGSIFRSAAALGVDGILLTPDCCDPFNRRSIRVSMGSVFKIPWTNCKDPVKELKATGYTTIAMALEKDSLPIDSGVFKDKERLAIFLGTEGEGLSDKMIKSCDYKAIIPMHHEIDSLNVGVAAAIAFWEFRKEV